MYADREIKQKVAQALENIRPDENAKDRMYLEVMRRASVQSAPKKPWYLRFRTSAGLCGMAMAFIVVAVAALHSRMPEDGAEKLSMADLPQETQTQTTTAAENIGTQLTQSGGTTPASSVTATTVVVTVKEERVTQSLAERKTETAGAAWRPEITLSQPVESDLCPEKTTVAAQTKPSNEQTQKPSVGTKPAQTAPAEDVKTDLPQTDAPTKTEVAVTMTEPVDIPIRQNIYLYYALTFQGELYTTDYMPITGSSLTYLGPGVTSGKDVDDTHTVLIYAIDGADQKTQLAVQYAGETEYYLFQAVN